MIEEDVKAEDIITPQNNKKGPRIDSDSDDPELKMLKQSNPTYK